MNQFETEVEMMIYLEELWIPQQKNFQEQMMKKRKSPNNLYNYKIPWSLRMAYAVNYNNSVGQNEISSHSLMFSGDVELSPKWSAGISSGYDFKNQGITYTQLRFERDLLVGG